MKTQMDPYAPVRLAPLVTPSGLSSDRQAVVLTFRRADGTENEEIVGYVGKNYKLITNQQVRDTAQDILGKAFPSANLDSDRLMFDGMQFEARWPLPVEATVTWNGVTDLVRMTGSAYNCYGGSGSCGLALNALVHACTNGLVISMHLGDYTLRHVEADSPAYSAETGRIAAEIVSNSHWEEMIARFKRMAATPLGSDAIWEFQQSVRMPEAIFADTCRRLAGNTEWSLYMAATAALRDEESFANEGWNRLVSLYFLNRQVALEQNAVKTGEIRLTRDMAELSTNLR
jgi:hypothetical protein